MSPMACNSDLGSYQRGPYAEFVYPSAGQLKIQLFLLDGSRRIRFQSCMARAYESWSKLLLRSLSRPLIKILYAFHNMTIASGV